MSEVLENPLLYGNLSFEKYSFGTEVEKSLTRLQAMLEVEGYAQKSPIYTKMRTLRSALIRDPRYNFKPIPNVEKPDTKEVALSLPAHDLTANVEQVFTSLTGWDCVAESRPSTSGYAIVRVESEGPLKDLIIPPNPSATWTESILKENFRKACFDKEISGTNKFKTMKILSIHTTEVFGKASISLEAIYK